MLLLLLFSSCSANLSVQHEIILSDSSAQAVHYSIVCFIHGDGDYIYHDTNGKKYKADEQTLAAAKKVAQQNPYAEVFIFHQKPRRHFLLFFPLRDGEFFYYRNGQLIVNELYWRDNEKSRFQNEVDLYHRFHENAKPEMVSMFLYYGHEIPELDVAGYDASYPDRKFTIDDLTTGMKDFTRDSARFDLMVLSTCFGGTPHSISALGSFAKTIIASPENLHLSYFDLSSLERLDLRMRDGDVPTYAKRFASQAFDQLTKDTQTEVSVVVYDVDRVGEFLRSVQMVYNHNMSAVKKEKDDLFSAIEHCDCADLPEYVLPTMNAGVDIFYRPALFGKSKIKQNHSGWECLRSVAP
ncbi:MAG: hypothetical protein Q8N83_04380 [Ignavibacteria bacterium]|nr:hypothetical protein [Ignavibacteria bacterium]